MAVITASEPAQAPAPAPGSTTTATTGHRLAELVMVLTGARIEDAELAVSRLDRDAAVAEDEALDTLARAVIRLYRARRR